MRRSTCLSCSMNYRTLNSSSNNFEMNYILMHKCTTFSTSRVFLRFLSSVGTGSTCYHNTLSNKIRSDRTSKHLDRLMHSMQSVFAKSLNLTKVKESGTQIHTIHSHIAEIYAVLIHWWKRTLSHYLAEVNAALLLCWAIPNNNSVSSYTQS